MPQATGGDMMSAWAVERPGPLAQRPLRLGERAVPAPGLGEVLVEVTACGVCRTDLHLATGDLAARRAGTVPGHEVVGRVVAFGPPMEPATFQGLAVGATVGVPWLRSTCGGCRFCERGDENLCPASSYTGWDHDGGFAGYVTVPAAFAYQLPAGYTDAELAPLLCAGIIGYRALRRARVPTRVAWASTVSGRARTSPPSSRSPGVSPSTSSPGRPPPAG